MDSVHARRLNCITSTVCSEIVMQWLRKINQYSYNGDNFGLYLNNS